MLDETEEGEELMLKDMKVPKLTESGSNIIIKRILKRGGDLISEDETIFEVETEKANVELASEYNGKIKKIFVKEDDEKEVGELLATIEI